MEPVMHSHFLDYNKHSWLLTYLNFAHLSLCVCGLEMAMACLRDIRQYGLMLQYKYEM